MILDVFEGQLRSGSRAPAAAAAAAHVGCAGRELLRTRPVADVAPGISGARMMFLVENVGICLAILGCVFCDFSA